MTADGITFNVVFTPGTPARLLPFSLTLLKGTGVRLRVVANGCGQEDVELLRAAAKDDERISHHVLPGSQPVAHGLALNHLFESFSDEPYFAFADSDVIASGDFMPGLWPMRVGQAGVFAAAPVWSTDADATFPPRWPVLSGRMHRLPDGTPVGNTYLAIYRRAAIERPWRRAPLGFGVHIRPAIPRAVRAALAARGWNYRIFDTGRLVNLLLLLDGTTLENRAVPELHHVGGFSSVSTPRVLMPSRGNRRPLRVAESLVVRLHLLRRKRNPRHRRLNERRRTIASYVGAVLDAKVAGEPIPAVPRTDSAEVDRRLAALVGAIETHYRPL